MRSARSPGWASASSSAAPSPATSFGQAPTAAPPTRTGTTRPARAWPTAFGRATRRSWPIVPFERGTFFVEDFTGLVYTIFGSSKLGGYFVFAWLSYWGLVLTLKAAIVAVPQLARKRYAVLLFATPSLVYWGSSIGKEAVVGLFLGMIAAGVALAFNDADRRRMGLGARSSSAPLGAAMIRPHFAAVWVGAAGIAFAVRLVHNLFQAQQRPAKRVDDRRIPDARARRRRIPRSCRTLTLNYLNPNEAPSTTSPAPSPIESQQIFDTTEDRTSTGRFDTRPGLDEQPRQLSVRGISDAHASADHRSRQPDRAPAGHRDDRPPRPCCAVVAPTSPTFRASCFGNPYLVFALVCVVTFGVAFASIGNLGILVRQRSLVLPAAVAVLVPARTRAEDVSRRCRAPSLRRTQPASTS